MSENGPGDAAVHELSDGDFAGEGAIGLVEDVLGCDFDAFAEVLACQEEVDGGRGNDDFGCRVDFGVVEVGGDFFDLGNGAIPVRCLLLSGQVRSGEWKDDGGRTF